MKDTAQWIIEYRSDDATKNFFCISAFWIPCIGGERGKTTTAQIWWESVHGAKEKIWPHEYLISHTEISINWPGSKQLWTRPIYTDFNGLIRYSWGHISGHHEPIHVKFGVWRFFIMFYWNTVMKVLICKKENLMTLHFSRPTLYCVNATFFFFWFLILPGCSFKCNHLFSHEAQGWNVPNSLTVGMGFHCSYVPSGI